jgi:hypothetical protein
VKLSLGPKGGAFPFGTHALQANRNSLSSRAEALRWQQAHAMSLRPLDT